jgi:UDP-N-acetylglucosamine 2-epimerase (non-hydrolysing)
VLVLRDETERPEAIEAGCARIVGARRRAIVDEVARLWSDVEAMSRMRLAGNPFGDGQASRRIVETLAGHFAVSETAVSAVA